MHESDDSRCRSPSDKDSDSLASLPSSPGASLPPATMPMGGRWADGLGCGAGGTPAAAAGEVALASAESAAASAAGEPT